MSKMIGVLVIDDSAFMRKVLRDIMESAHDIKVVGTAKNGLEALEMVRELHPDVITLDLNMPSMDGLTCLRELQKITDAPVIMLSSLTVEGGKATIEALEAGAIDFVTKPSNMFEISGEQKKVEIIKKIRMAYRFSKKKRTFVENCPKAAVTEQRQRSSELKALIAIGSSTGGPRALQEVIPYIPEDIPAAVLVVQHMPPGFTRSLAERLDSLSGMTVKEGDDNEIICPGYVYLAPGDFHMEVVKDQDGRLRIRLTKNEPEKGHRPSVNVLMKSIAKTGFPNVIGVIMTGMGNDGKEGVISIKEKNKGVIICQDEMSCVVYGMPKAVVNTGLADAIVPLKEIAGMIVKYLGVEQ
ncbi:MAG TPA: chemotaxis response regulator protein-glutamate methylesterase [Clostridiales bacterium]|nr:chemotaxis response regulator protein-glutamate methylesterase [Clostridiales bacterium]HPV01539.1 chemotaxis response regulator protein-glutamate methylesterase [Clostridiales bacterium]